jgi:hypothetical protein
MWTWVSASIVGEYASVLACSAVSAVNFEGAQCIHLEHEAHPTTRMLHPDDGRTVLLWSVAPKDLHYLLAVSVLIYLISDYFLLSRPNVIVCVGSLYLTPSGCHFLLAQFAQPAAHTHTHTHTQLSCRTKWHQITYCTSVRCACVLLLMTVVTLDTDKLMRCICMFCGLAVCNQNSTTEGKHNGGSVI